MMIVMSWFALFSCGKDSKNDGNRHVEKGKGKLVLQNAEEVLNYTEKMEEATIDEKIMMGPAPTEEYVLVIEDIERGDDIEITEARVNSWLTEEQKIAIKKNNGCLKVSFFDAVYYPEREERKAFFSPGSIAFEGSWSCEP